jgi:sporulation protein YlmC with PRC-barrel domain
MLGWLKPEPQMKLPRANLLFATLTLVAASGTTALAADAIALVHVDVTVVAQGYRTSELLHRTVYNDKNEKIGTFDDLMISKDGKALAAILQVGGFLGLGGHLVAVPYKSVVMKDNENKILLPGATKEALGALGEFHYAH